MFGIFKKRAPPPSLELSDVELDLIHGGRALTELEPAPAATAFVQEFVGPDGMVAVVGRGDLRGPRG